MYFSFIAPGSTKVRIEYIKVDIYQTNFGVTGGIFSIIIAKL